MWGLSGSNKPLSQVLGALGRDSWAQVASSNPTTSCVYWAYCEVCLSLQSSALDAAACGPRLRLKGHTAARVEGGFTLRFNELLLS